MLLKVTSRMKCVKFQKNLAPMRKIGEMRYSYE